MSGDAVSCFTTTLAPARTRFNGHSAGIRQDSGWHTGTVHGALTVGSR